MSVFISIVVIIGLIFAAIRATVGQRRNESGRLERVDRKYSDPSTRSLILEKKIWQGMTQDELIDSWGNPEKITQTVLKTKIKETYRYGSNRYGSSVYIENGRVVGWRQPK